MLLLLLPPLDSDIIIVDDNWDDDHDHDQDHDDNVDDNANNNYELDVADDLMMLMLVTIPTIPPPPESPATEAVFRGGDGVRFDLHRSEGAGSILRGRQRSALMIYSGY